MSPTTKSTLPELLPVKPEITLKEGEVFVVAVVDVEVDVKV